MRLRLSIFLCLGLLGACSSDKKGNNANVKKDAAPMVGDASTAVDSRDHDSVPVPDAPVCVPTDPSIEVCDLKDNDCNGFADDVDQGEDGIYDCLKIALLGNPGAFSSSNFQTWLQSNGVKGVDRIQTDGTTALTREVLDQYNIVILDRLVREYTADEAQVLVDWVTAGGGVVSMSGYSGGASDRTYPNSLLALIGLEYRDPLQGGPVTQFDSHIVVAGLTSVSFNGGFAVAAVDGATGGVNTIVATLPSGDAAAMVQVRGQGRVFVWGDEWIEFDSEWNSIPDVKKLWANVTAWLGHFYN